MAGTWNSGSISTPWNPSTTTRRGPDWPGPPLADLRRQNRNWNFSAANHTGYSNTHSLQAEVERRYSSGLAYQVFYTFTRALNTTDVGGFTSGNGGINNTDGGNAVPENINLIGAPNLTYDERLKLIYYNSREVPAQRVRYNGIYTLPIGKGKKYASGAGGARRCLDRRVGSRFDRRVARWPVAQRRPGWLAVRRSNLNAKTNGLDLTFAGRKQRLWFRGDFDPRLASNVDAAALQALVPVDRGARVFHPLGDQFQQPDSRKLLRDGTARLTAMTRQCELEREELLPRAGAWNVDASLFKNFVFKERYRVRSYRRLFQLLQSPARQRARMRPLACRISAPSRTLPGLSSSRFASSGRTQAPALFFLAAGLACAQTGELYRFDDNLKGASVSAPQGSQTAVLAPPMSWKSFTQETTWQLVRGRIGIRAGEMIVQGQGSSPVILAPKDLSIDWSRYETVRIRMMAEGGNEIKIRIGDYELKQKLAPPREYQVYSFDLNLNMPTYGRPLAIMPTDSVNQLVSISSIELVPRRMRFTEAAGRQNGRQAGGVPEYPLRSRSVRDRLSTSLCPPAGG